MQSEIELRINEAHDRLRDSPDNELKNKFLDGFSYSEMKDSKKDKINNWGLICASPIFYDGIAAQRILQKRHGLEYCQKVLGYRLPKKFKEKIVYYFTGDLIKV